MRSEPFLSSVAGMNYRYLWATPLLFGFLGCDVSRLSSQVPPSPAASTSAPSSGEAVQAVSSTVVSPTIAPSIAPPTSAASSQLAQTSDSVNGSTTESTRETEIRRDYAATAPLPSTGQVTIRNSIRNLDLSQLIAECPPDSAPYAFAESTNYRVQICSQEYDPWQPKYYIGQAKDGSGELRITSSNPETARQLIFEHSGYTYAIYRDGARPELLNAYLQVFTPSGENYAEALLYLYEAGATPR